MFRQAFGLSCTRGSASVIAAAIKKNSNKGAGRQGLSEMRRRGPAGARE